MKNIKILFVGLALASATISGIKGQIMIGATSIDTISIITSLDTPWEILWGPDNYIWFTERSGKVSRLNPTTGTREILITIAGVHEESESGLLGMTLDRSFPAQPYVYLVYNYLLSGNIRERIVRYTYADNVLKDPMTLLENIIGSVNHNGSRVAIGPDNKLYMTTGDAQNTSNAQDLNSVNGKILRMNLDGSIPSDNPTNNSYVWTFGHRNPQGLVFTPNGKLYSSEHGPDNDDELNLIEKGRNYGWPDVQGFCDGASEMALCTSWNVREPLYSWTPTLAVTGIDYYNNAAIPEWKGCILMTSLKASKLVSLKLSSDGTGITGVNDWLVNTFGRLRDICIAPDGRIFLAVSNKDGRGTPKTGDDRIVQIKARLNTSTPTILDNSGDIRIYPNPMNTNAQLQVSDAFAGGKVTIINSTGKFIFGATMKGTTYDLYLHIVIPGYYIVKVDNGKDIVQASLIITR